MEKPLFEQLSQPTSIDISMAALFTTDTDTYLNLSEADEIELLVHVYSWLTSGCEMTSAEREHIDYVLNRFNEGKNPTTADLQAIQSGLSRCQMPSLVIPLDGQGGYRPDDAARRFAIHIGVRKEFELQEDLPVRRRYEKPPMKPTSEIMSTLLDGDGYESESDFISWFESLAEGHDRLAEKYREIAIRLRNE